MMLEAEAQRRYVNRRLELSGRSQGLPPLGYHHHYQSLRDRREKKKKQQLTKEGSE